MQISSSISASKITLDYTAQRKGSSPVTRQQARRRSGTKKTKVREELKPLQPTSTPSQQHLKRDACTRKVSRALEDESIFDIVYSASSQLMTPPPSPKASLVSQSFEANDRVLSAKRQGLLKSLMSEYTALKKDGLLLTDHTYNLIFDSYATLRRDGTPLTPMLKMYDEMLRSEIQPSSSTYTILIRTLCKRDVEVQKVIAMLKRQSARSSKSQSNSISELESEENIKKALDMFNAAVSEHLVRFFDAELYNQILRVLSHYGDTEKSLYVYRQLEMHAGPTSATFAALINLFGRVGDMDSALYYFIQYKQLKDSIGRHDASYVYNALVDAHLKCDKLEGALQVISTDMKYADVKFSTIPYNSVIRYYCLKNRLDEAKELIQSMKEASLRPDASSYGPILSSFCQLGLYKEATEMYDLLVQTDISKSYGNLANYILLCLDDIESSTKVIHVMKDMQTAGLELDPNLVERTLVTFAKYRQVPQAIAVLCTILKNSKPRYLAKYLPQIKKAAIQVAVTAEGNFDQVMEISRLIAPHGLPNELATVLVDTYRVGNVVFDYSILLDAAIAIGSEPSFLSRLYSDMVAKGEDIQDIKPRFSAYLSRADDTDMDAQKWEVILNNEGKTVTTSVTEADEASAAVMKAALAGRHEEALCILRTRIIDAHLVPISEPLRDAIAFIGKQGHLQSAVDMYHLAIKRFKECDAQRSEHAIYMLTNSILIGYAQQGDMIHAKKYYEEIKSMGRYPDGNGYASLLLGSAKCAAYEATDALAIYNEAKCCGVRPTTFFYNVIISKLAKARKHDIAMRLFEEMETTQVPMDEATYQTMIDTLTSNDQLHCAEKLYTKMQSVIQKSSSPYIENVFIRGYGQKGLLDKAKAMFDMATNDKNSKETSTVREPSTYEAMARAYIENGKAKEAQEVLSLMTERGFPEKVTALVAELVHSL